jgi:L-aspartate oxidase
MTNKVDFLVVGSGAAGLSFALEVARFGSVAVVTKKEPAESNTNYAQGGIAAVITDDDSFEQHVQDTLTAGAGLCDEAVVRTIVTEGPERIEALVRYGASFSRDKDGELELGREGGHGMNRIVHAADTTGREVERSLLERVRAEPNIRVYEHHFALEIITDHHLGVHVARVHPDIRCYGVYVFDERSGRVETFLSKVTMLASGGAGQVYQHTTNPAVATGDGLAMAYRAKARMENMEFVQFHPTTLYHDESPAFLISEAVRGEGAVLLNFAGERFMPAYDAREELAPRDIVARAIDDQLKIRGDNHVWLDISAKTRDFLRNRFPHIYETCLSAGIDIATDPIPVVPAAHYMCGGVKTDVNGQTSIQNLLASGEVACTGLHGANRLASNSLLEALVVGHRAVELAVRIRDESSWNETIPEWDDSGTVNPAEWVLISHNRDEVRRVMWDYVGIVRSSLRLERAARRTRLIYEETEDFYRKSKVSAPLCELRNLIAVAYMIIRSSRMRKESRGLHFMSDHPEPRQQESRPSLL